MARRPDESIVLTTASTEFEAEAVVAALRERGVDAYSITSVGTVMAIFGPALNQPIQVLAARRDAERAAAALRDRWRESADINWDDVDLGGGEHGPEKAAGVWRRRAPGILGLALGLILLAPLVVSGALGWASHGSAGWRALALSPYWTEMVALALVGLALLGVSMRSLLQSASAGSTAEG